METAMTNTAQPMELSVRISDASLLKDIKHAIKMIRGVEKVSIKKASPPTQTSKKHLSGLDEALLDVEEGRVYEAQSVKDMFRQILGEDYV